MNRKSGKGSKGPAKAAAAKKGAAKKGTAKKGRRPPRVATEPTPILRADLEKIIYKDAGLRRYTQDSPVLPDVWFQFGKGPRERTDLLLTPHRDSTPGEVANEILRRLATEGARRKKFKFKCDDSRGHDVAFNQSTVVARLCFSELIRVVLPMTDWWRDYIWAGDGRWLKSFLTDRGFRYRQTDTKLPAAA